jgi:DNA-binding XRE family transcriptional regulator
VELANEPERRHRHSEARVDGRRYSDDSAVAAAMERLQLRLSANVRALRKRSGWTQEQTALEAGIHRDSLHRIEKATANPVISTLVRLAHVFDCELVVTLRRPWPGAS